MLANLKICGITTRETARFCAASGVGALGVIFYRKSPRYVAPEQARSLFEGLPAAVARVGVFVDESAGAVIAAAQAAAITTVQLHGGEPLETVLGAQRAGFRVVKVLKSTGKKLLEEASRLPPTVGILVECGHGTLPGGNGAAWSWAEAAPLAGLRPFAVAGGLTPQNLAEAARLSQAAAWDVSSGVENAPGKKNHEAILELVKTARTIASCGPERFWLEAGGTHHT